MRIKVFRERTSKDAMDKVRMELGPDAVILHTRKYKTGGILGYGGKKMVEITAAVEDQPLPKTTAPDKIKTSVPESTIETIALRPIVPKKVLDSYKATEFRPVKQKTQESSISKNKGSESKIIKAADKVKMDSNEQEQQKRIQELEHQLAQMKVVLDKVVGSKFENNSQPVKEIVSLNKALSEQEVDEDIIREIMQSSNPNTVLNKDDPAAKTLLLQYLERYMSASAGIEIEEGKPKIIALIGATGVGKTTTLAKIASRFVLEQGLRALLITADTYRISAVDQLKTYSDIIGLPLEIVYTNKELTNVIHKHADKQLILIDTAGRSQHNDYQLQELHDLLNIKQHIEKHLVLSATTKYKDAVEIIKKFSICMPDKVIFTKSDETSSIGIVLNLLRKYSLTLSYLTNGQSVPDDIFPGQPEILAQLLLR